MHSRNLILKILPTRKIETYKQNFEKLLDIINHVENFIKIIYIYVLDFDIYLLIYRYNLT